MTLLSIYDSFPAWMGIHSVTELVLAIISALCILFFYFAIGGVVCPHSIKKHWVRMIMTIIWPVWVVLIIIAFPFRMLYEFSKPAEVQEQEIKEFMEEINNEDKTDKEDEPNLD